MNIPTSPITIFFFVLAGGFLLPLPHESVVVLAGYYASASGSNILLAMLATFLATIGADTLIYGLSRLGGPIVNRLRAMAPKIDGAYMKKFSAHPALTMIISRFIAGLRMTATVYAGSQRMPLWKFELYNAAAVGIYVPVFFLIGHASHNGLASVFAKLSLVQHVMAAVALVAVVAAVSFIAGRALLARLKN